VLDYKGIVMKYVLYMSFILVLFVGCKQTRGVPETTTKAIILEEGTDISFAKFSPDGTKIAAGGRDMSIRIWDEKTRKKLQTLEGVTVPLFFPDGRKITGVDTDENARIFDVESGKELHKLEGRITSLSPDGKRGATFDKDNTTLIWDTDTGKKRQIMEGSRRSFSPDNQKIATWNKEGIRICDAETGKELQRLDGMVPGRLGGGFFQDGKKIVTEVRINRGSEVTRICDVESGKVLQEFPGEFVAISPDGKKIIIQPKYEYINNANTRVWDIELGKELYTLNGNDARFSPDGRKIVTGHGQKFRIHNVDTGKELHDMNGAIFFYTFLLEGKKIVALSADRFVHILDTESGKELKKLEGVYRTCSPDGKKILEEPYDRMKPARIWILE
jgi:WD40 repeat protein